MRTLGSKGIRFSLSEADISTATQPTAYLTGGTTAHTVSATDKVWVTEVIISVASAVQVKMLRSATDNLANTEFDLDFDAGNLFAHIKFREPVPLTGLPYFKSSSGVATAITGNGFVDN